MREQMTQARATDPEARKAMLAESWRRTQQKKAAGQAVDAHGEAALRKLIERHAPSILQEAQR